MEWLTRELTPIEKVRRNVVLLATLAILAAFFPIQTDEVTVLGARFTSDVVTFGLFHALTFYTSVFALRAYGHWRIFDQAARNAVSNNWEQTRSSINDRDALTRTVEQFRAGKVVDPISQQMVTSVGTDFRAASGRALAEASQRQTQAESALQGLKSDRAFLRVARAYVGLGEFAFPVVYGTMAAYFLLVTQAFPMLWELHLRTG